MHLLILPYFDCSDSHAYTISLELCAGFNDSTHKTSLLHFESVILYAPLHKDKLRTTAGDRGGAGLFSKILAKFANFWKKKTAKISAIFNENFEIRERCKGVHCVDLGESFPTHIFLQNLASMQQRTSLVKFLVRKSFSVLVRQQTERLVSGFR